MMLLNLASNRLTWSRQHFNIFRHEYGFKTDSNSLFTFPLLAEKIDDEFRVIYGFSCQNLADELPCYVIDSALSSIEKSQIVVQYHTQFSPVNVQETAKMLALLQKDEKLSELPAGFLNLLGISGQTGRLDKIVGLTQLPDEVHQYLESKNASLKYYFPLLDFDETGLGFISKVMKWQPSLSVFREIVTHLFEIMKRDKTSTTVLLEKINFVEFENADFSDAEKLGQLREKLLHQRYPNLSVRQERIQNAIADLNLPASVKLTYDTSLESKRIQLLVNLAAGNIGDLDKLSDEDLKSKLKQIFELL